VSYSISLILNLLLLIIICILLQKPVKRWWRWLKQQWKDYRPRQWRPKSPDDCPQCQAGICLQVIRTANVVPYPKRKNSRGRKKKVPTQGYACLNPDCAYCGIVDDRIHALIGYGTHNGIQRLKCQACRKVFSSRKGTPLYYLKTAVKTIELVLFFQAEGVDTAVLVRYTGHSEATITRWLERMGRHSAGWHHYFFRNLFISYIQVDELYTRVRSSSSAAWLWVATDPISKVMLCFHVGKRTSEDAYIFLHELKQLLHPSCIPAFTSDGLRQYFHSITAHFGEWHRPPRARKDHWKPHDDLLYGQLVKRKGRYSGKFAVMRMLWGTRRDFNLKMKALGFKQLIQTAFIERLNLTLRQSIAPLTRKTWSYAQSEQSLTLHVEWFRLYYHMVRAHESLREEVPGHRRPYRKRSPAMALGLTDHFWSISDMLTHPVPQVA